MNKHDLEFKKHEYLYQSSGIRERPGHIPVWLILVAVALTIWGVYYLVSFWQPIETSIS